MDRDKEIRQQRHGRQAEAVIEPAGITRGASWSGHERNHFWWNQEGKNFLELSGISDVDVPYDSRTFAWLDFDHDGFEDFVMVNANRPWVQLFRNQFGSLLPKGKRGRSLRLRLHGGNRLAQANPEWSNRDGIGAQIRVKTTNGWLLREYRCGEGLGAQNSCTLSVGIAPGQEVEQVEIRWPSGKQSQLGPLAAEGLWEVYENPEQSPQPRAWFRQPYRPVPLATQSVPSAPLPSPVLPALLASVENQAEHALVMTWFLACPACKRAEPELWAIRAAFAAKELGIFGFNVRPEDSLEARQQYYQQYRPAFTPLQNRSQADISAVNALLDQVLAPPARQRGETGFAASGITPCTLLLNAQGEVEGAWLGLPTISQLKQRLYPSR